MADPEIVAVAKELDPALIVTVDNGVSSIQGVKVAKASRNSGSGDRPPSAGFGTAGCGCHCKPECQRKRFPSKKSGRRRVMFYVLIALRQRLSKPAGFDRLGIVPPNLAELLDLVALGTVADVVPLDHNNRILVHQGLQRIRAGCCCGYQSFGGSGTKAVAPTCCFGSGFCYWTEAQRRWPNRGYVAWNRMPDGDDRARPANWQGVWIR